MTESKKSRITQPMKRANNPPTEREVWDASAARLVKVREALGLRSVDMATALGIDKAKQSKYEHAVEKMRFDYLWKLEKTYGIRVSYLLTGSTIGLPPEIKKRLENP